MARKTSHFRALKDLEYMKGGKRNFKNFLENEVKESLRGSIPEKDDDVEERGVGVNRNPRKELRRGEQERAGIVETLRGLLLRTLKRLLAKGERQEKGATDIAMLIRDLRSCGYAH
ncbi:hypothetical protein HPP92_016046 [Vanilla planifolia]|uniref:Uncharacterized protein n=1 Tax=Vanilla planifolia TaxID=51239 RepID=A0A835USL2_VANPL|nr:hypothetical protein HPP92_016046 [Vanilla planifolia]